MIHIPWKHQIWLHWKRSSSHESSIFQIKLKRNTGCFSLGGTKKENERHTNDFRKARRRKNRLDGEEEEGEEEGEEEEERYRNIQWTRE